MKRYLILIILLVTPRAFALDNPPNILLIMADDPGVEVLPCYGNTVYSTPHLDRMASEGALFENAYATPVWTPTRAMILTGLYPNRSGSLANGIRHVPIEPLVHNQAHFVVERCCTHVLVEAQCVSHSICTECERANPLCAYD
jgi:hypothetical protein